MHAQVRLAFKAQGGHRGERTVILPIFAPLHAGSRLATRLPAGLPTPVHLQIGPPLGAGAVPQPSAARSPLGLDLLTSLAPPPMGVSVKARARAYISRISPQGPYRP